MAKATFSLFTRESAAGREKYYANLVLDGHKTSRFVGYQKDDAHNEGIRLCAEYLKDPSAFFTKSKLKGSGIEAMKEEFLERPVSDDTNDLNRTHLDSFIAMSELSSVDDIDKYVLRTHKKEMKRSGAADGYISMRLRVIRAFINFCLDKKYLKIDPWPSNTDQRSSGGGPLIPSYRSKGYFYTDKELLALTTPTDPDSEAQQDIIRAIKLALFQGWREEHVWAFHPERLNLEKRTYRLHEMKGAPEKEVPLIQPTIDMLEQWSAPASGRFFSRWGAKDALALAFRRWRKTCGEKGDGVKKGRFHDLKHTCISKMLEAGYTIPEIAEFTNTSKAALVHYTHVSKKRLEDKLATYQPLQDGTMAA